MTAQAALFIVENSIQQVHRLPISGIENGRVNKLARFI